MDSIEREIVGGGLLCSRFGAAGFANKCQDFGILFKTSIGTTADRTNDPFFQVSLKQRGEGLLVWSSHENGPSVFNRCIERKFAPEIIQKIILVAT